MTIVIDENLVAIWFIDLPPAEDYLMSLSRVPNGGMRFVYRVRHHSPQSTDPFDEHDDKSWHTFETDDPNVEKAISAARSMARGLLGVAAAIHGGKAPEKVYEFIRKPGVSAEAFMEEFMKAPFVHVQRKTVQ
jgi:hypothetical protein